MGTDLLSRLGRVLAWTFVIGGTCFLIGFVGPMLFRPDANQGPLLGILITGPLGVMAGFITGIVREVAGWHHGPVATFARLGITGVGALRTGALIVGVAMVLQGFASLRSDTSRGPASAIVVGGVFIWYAAVGALPRWFGRRWA